MNKRYLFDPIEQDLAKKMVFIGGPRQVGKTTLSLSLIHADKSSESYLNWDVAADRKLILSDQIPLNQRLIVLDEIHKFKKWRGLVKGLYDKHVPDNNFIVTGSARLDYYRHGGDSLMGRYHYYRLHPLSIGEVTSSPTRDDILQLLKFGGFPEPFFSQDERFLRRWQVERSHRIIAEDLRDLENVRHVDLIQLLLESLPARVGSPLSIENLRNDLEVHHSTVKKWISILERLYMCFMIAPYGAPRIRAVKKEQKLYFWDWAQIPEQGPRFENLVASQLLKYCHFIEDTEGYKMELRFLRDTDGREVDFVVLKNKAPLFAVECKSGEKEISKHALYFRERTKIPLFFQVHLGTRDYGSQEKTVRVLPFHKFCKEMNLP